jgi:hypothetical protein
MPDEITNLKAELEALNLQCQLARDHEIRHALQRTRLETARMQLMLKIMDAIASSASDISAAPIKPMVKARPDAIRTVTIPAKLARMPAVKPRRKRKPSGLPTLTNMILAVLENGADETPEEPDAVVFRKCFVGLSIVAIPARPANRLTSAVGIARIAFPSVNPSRGRGRAAENRPAPFRCGRNRMPLYFENVSLAFRSSRYLRGLQIG